MGWLSQLGDFIGSGFNAGTSAFDDGLHGNTASSLADLWGPVGDSLPGNIGDEVQNNVLYPMGNFVDDQYDAFGSHLKDIGNGIKSDPVRFLTAGIDPLSTGIYNAVTGKHDQPLTDQFGGMTQQEWQNAAGRGVNTENAGYMSTLAHMAAAYYGGQALAGLGSSGYASIFGDTSGAGANTLGGFTGANAGGAADVAEGGAGLGAEVGGAGSDAQSIFGLEQGLGGVSAGATGAAGGATRGAGIGVANAENNGTNPWTAAVKGGLSGGIGSGMDLAGTAGIDNPYLKSGVNGALNGGVRAGMTDPNQTGYGALVGGLQGLIGKGANAVGSYFSQPSSGDGGASGTTNWGNLATGLGNMYLASRNNAGIQGQINNLNQLYSPNSAYAQQMQQTLDRQDAAGGRRSQYGTRQVELQAALANAASRNAPTLSNLYSQQRQNRFSQYAGMLGTARNSGLLGGLGGMFGNNNQGGTDNMSYINQPAQMPTYNGTYNDVMNTQMPPLDPSQYSGG